MYKNTNEYRSGNYIVMSKKIKFIARLKINCNYNGDIEFENDEELL